MNSWFTRVLSNIRWISRDVSPAPKESVTDSGGGDSSPDPKENVNGSRDEAAVLWCIEAKIVKDRLYGEGGAEIKNGIRLFRGGAKVFIIGAYPGMCESVVLVGHHRKSVKLICSVVKVTHVSQFRVRPIYKKKVIEIAKSKVDVMDGAVIPITNKTDMEALASSFPMWQKMILKN